MTGAEIIALLGAVGSGVAGGFYRDDYLHLNYKNKDKAVFQHGLIILHWPNNPTTLKGKFIGIGRDSNEIVSVQC